MLKELLSNFKELKLKWKVIVILLVVALVAGLFSAFGTTSTEEEETKPETAKIEAKEEEKDLNEEDHHLDIEQMQKLVEDEGYKTGYNESVDEAKQWLVDNQSKMIDQYHISAEYLYLELISPTNGGAFTEDAAAEAVKSCEYNFKANALYWANMYASIGVTNTDAIKKELMHDHRFGGGFTEGEASYAIANMTATEDDADSYTGGFEVEYVEESNAYKTDVESCATILKKMKEQSLPKREVEYQIQMNYGYSYNTYLSALETVNMNWVIRAKDVAERYKSEEITDLRKVMMELIDRFGGFPEGCSAYASGEVIN